MSDDAQPGDVVIFPDSAGWVEPPAPDTPTGAAGAAAYAIDQRLRANLRRMRGLWIEVARDLHQFHGAELWRDLGHENFEAWLADVEQEFEIGGRWVYNSIALYEQLVIQRGVDPSRLQRLQISKVSEVLPAIRRGLISVDQALEDAEQLRRSDLELKYRGVASDGRTAGPDTSTTVHTEREPEWKTCQCCGSTYRATPTES